MMRQKKKKNAAMAKQMRYTAKYPTTWSQMSHSFSQKCGILSSSFLIPGIKTIQEVIRPKRRNNEYTILVEVEFLQVGQALQHKPHAAAPQQQAKFAAQAAAEHAPKTAPMLRLTQT